MAENLDNIKPATPTPSVPPATPAAAPSVIVPPKAPQAKKETIRISLPPRPTAPGKVAAAPAAPGAAAAPAGAPAAPGKPGVPSVPEAGGLKMSGTPGPQHPAPTKARNTQTTAPAKGKVQMIDQILAIAVAVVAIACVVTSFMLNGLGNDAGF